MDNIVQFPEGDYAFDKFVKYIIAFTMDTGPAEDDPKPRDKRVLHYSRERYDGDWPPESLVEFVKWAKRKLDEIPKGSRRSAKIEIGSAGGYDGDHNPEIEITYTRPETAEEVAERVAAYAAKVQRANDFKRAEYERLKAEFEG